VYRSESQCVAKALFLQVDRLKNMMLEGGGSDHEAGGKGRKENRRETWAPGLGALSVTFFPSQIVQKNAQEQFGILGRGSGGLVMSGAQD